MIDQDLKLCDCTNPPRNEPHFDNAPYFLTFMHQKTHEWLANTMSQAQLLLLERARRHIITRRNDNPPQQLLFSEEEKLDIKKMPDELKATMAILLTPPPARPAQNRNCIIN